MRNRKSAVAGELPTAKGRLRRRLLAMLGIGDPRELEMIPRQGTVSYVRWTLEHELGKVARVQNVLFRPIVEIKQITPGVAIGYLVGMKFVSAKQLEALQRAADEALPLGVRLILTLKSKKGNK